jgi:hypothetical protein
MKNKFNKFEYAASFNIYSGIMLGIRTFELETEFEHEETKEKAYYTCYSTLFSLPFVEFTFDILVKQN